jgi:hypothetical protein
MDRERLEKTTYTDLAARVPNWVYQTEQDRTDLRETVAVYSDEALRRLSLLCSQDCDLARGVALHVMQGEIEQITNESVFFYQLTNSTDYWKTTSEVRALGQYDPTSFYADLSKEDSYVTDQCLALMTVARLIDGTPESRSPFLEYIPTDNSNDMTVIRNNALVNFIVAHTARAEEIAGVIREYGTDDPSTILGIMDGNTPSLAAGTL